MPVYDLPNSKKHPDLSHETTVRIALWSTSSQLIRDLGKQLGLNLALMGFVESTQSACRLDLKTRRHISDAYLLLLALAPRGPTAASQDLWFQNALDEFRDASYLHNFLTYCKSTSSGHTLEVGSWGRGSNFGKESVLFRMNNQSFAAILEAMEQIRLAVCG